MSLKRLSLRIVHSNAHPPWYDGDRWTGLWSAVPLCHWSHLIWPQLIWPHLAQDGHLSAHGGREVDATDLVGPFERHPRLCCGRHCAAPALSGIANGVSFVSTVGYGPPHPFQGLKLRFAAHLSHARALRSVRWRSGMHHGAHPALHSFPRHSSMAAHSPLKPLADPACALLTCHKPASQSLKGQSLKGLSLKDLSLMGRYPCGPCRIGQTGSGRGDCVAVQRPSGAPYGDPQHPVPMCISRCAALMRTSHGAQH